MRPIPLITVPAPQRIFESAAEKFERRQVWNNEYARKLSIPSSRRLEPSHALVEIDKQVDLGGGKALDLGCGNGRNSIFLATRGFEVTALDFANTALALLQERSQSPAVAGKISVVNHDLYDGLPFSNNEFDVVLDSYCLCHFTEEKRLRLAIDECWRVLKSNGLLIKIHLDDRDQYYVQRKIRTTDFGFVSQDPENGIQKLHTDMSRYHSVFAPMFCLENEIRVHFHDQVGGATYLRSVSVGVFKKKSEKRIDG